ncbi:MAG TPA: TetR/AcrR family transcriptional regulator [Acidimicrobiales bacterium]|nr:TetR/AcrR family transcriptional regulator [Acidimicrobiales bacterium]
MARGVAVSEPSPAPLLAGLLGRLPKRPAPSLDRALDATAVCLARHGLARTSMTDVAKEMGVARSTLYRSFSSVEEAAWALFARDTWRFFDEFGDLVASGSGPEAVVALTVRFVRFATAHPVIARLLHDEPEFVGRVVSGNFAELVDQAARAVTPLVSAAVEGGLLARRDPRRLAQWLGRVVAICILAPPPGDIEELLDEMLLPVLAPG